MVGAIRVATKDNEIHSFDPLGIVGGSVIGKMRRRRIEVKNQKNLISSLYNSYITGFSRSGIRDLLKRF